MITRIRELLETRQLSPTQFADLIGVGRPVISHILSERNKPSLEVVQKIIGAFPDISLPWLLAGTGPMLAITAAPAPSAPIRNPEAISPPSPAIISAPIAAPAAVAPAVPTAFSVAPARVGAVTPPSSYIQPPKFRPAAAKPNTSANADQAGPSSSTAEAAFAAVPSPSAVSSATAAPTTVAEPEPAPLAAAQVTLPPQPAIAAPTAPSVNLREVTSAVEPVSTPPALAEVAAPTNPAAALSFLGEPGKAIRRIVIFYRDGSFSDYVPEGN